MLLKAELRNHFINECYFYYLSGESVTPVVLISLLQLKNVCFYLFFILNDYRDIFILNPDNWQIWFINNNLKICLNLDFKYI